MRHAAMLAGAVLLAGCAPPPEVTGRALYGAHCAVCHGADARGGAGPDLTAIRADAGGVFPTLRVLDHIDGYARVRAGPTAMPEFGAALQEGGLVMVASGDGGRTPVPERLVALAAYLESVQRQAAARQEGFVASGAAFGFGT